MRRFSLCHRITAALTSVLLLQLLLAASGTLCRMHGDHAMSDASIPNEMSGHIMAPHAAPVAMGVLSSVSAVDDASMSVPGHCDMAGMNEPCGGPTAPSGCTSMGACVNAVSAVATPTASANTSLVATVSVGSTTSMPPGPAFAPELPPPRA